MKLNIDDYPAIKNHLSGYQEELRSERQIKNGSNFNNLKGDLLNFLNLKNYIF
jgi:hypothetical protein